MESLGCGGPVKITGCQLARFFHLNLSLGSVPAMNTECRFFKEHARAAGSEYRAALFFGALAVGGGKFR